MRLREIQEAVAEQVVDPEDLVGLLELTIEEILERFPDKLMEHASKFGLED